MSDPACTDCGGTGITYQTERPCACLDASTVAPDPTDEAVERLTEYESKLSARGHTSALFSAYPGESSFSQAVDEHAADLRLLLTERTRHIAALEKVGRQKTSDELHKADMHENADFEGGYDALVEIARAALKDPS